MKTMFEINKKRAVPPIKTYIYEHLLYMFNNYSNNYYFYN